MELRGVLVSLDCVEATIQEAIERDCNLVVCHHPIVFSGLKRFNNQGHIQRTVQLAIKNDVAIYAIHTNLDNVFKQGVNTKISELLDLRQTSILQAKRGLLLKLSTYVPKDQTAAVLNALFAAGAGHIGNYSGCSFSTDGHGTFKGNEQSNPSVGLAGVQHTEEEQKVEVILRSHLEHHVLSALKQAHPYEEVAYEFYPITNADQEVGSGMVGELKEAMSAEQFLAFVKEKLQCDTIKYTPVGKAIKRVAVCGGSGSFLIGDAKAAKADAFVTSDIKYHQFFEAEGQLLYCDVGHYESEKFTIDLLYDILTQKFTTFAVLKTNGVTNPVNYYH
jgi:dinuclear metal center YbgI/SA1388 family protein